MKSLSIFFTLSRRVLFLITIFLLICFIQFALISQILSRSEESSSLSSFDFISDRVICKEKLRCPNHLQQLSIHIDQNDQYPNVSFIRSPIFATILNTIRQSSYYTNDSQSACVHLAPVDTIDRDRRSKNEYYVYFIEQRLKFFSQWSDPNKTHLIFNHYTGTWPSYRRALDFRLPSHYILASTSFTFESYNCPSHITFPLFHSDYPGNLSQTLPAVSRSILLSFKGKSYADVQHHRTFFRHFNNDRDIIIKYTDDQGNSSDPNEYVELLRQSHFCLVPSGRRSYSYRFLETLQYGCIPVITTNDNESIILPFSETIDWSRAVIVYTHLSLSLLPYYLKQIDENQREQMRTEGFNIWSKYFSSIEQIVITFLDILNARFVSFSSPSVHS